jgi:hypothetical protein
MENNTEETAAALRRKIEQARAYYFHCMDYRLYDLAEKTRLEINADVAALNSLSA